MKLSRRTRRAIARYSEQGCLAAAKANLEGYGPSGAFYNVNCGTGIRSVAAMNSAMTAGHEILAARKAATEEVEWPAESEDGAEYAQPIR